MAIGLATKIWMLQQSVKKAVELKQISDEDALFINAYLNIDPPEIDFLNNFLGKKISFNDGSMIYKTGDDPRVLQPNAKKWVKKMDKLIKF